MYLTYPDHSLPLKKSGQQLKLRPWRIAAYWLVLRGLLSLFSPGQDHPHWAGLSHISH